MKLGCLDIVDGWSDGDGQTDVYKFLTKPDFDAYVPKSLQKHFLKGKFQYVDIIRYDPRHIAHSPFRLHVSSSPPILPDQVRLISHLAWCVCQHSAGKGIKPQVWDTCPGVCFAPTTRSHCPGELVYRQQWPYLKVTVWPGIVSDLLRHASHASDVGRQCQTTGTPRNVEAWFLIHMILLAGDNGVHAHD